MKKNILTAAAALLLLVSCKPEPRDYLTEGQWVATSYIVNGNDLMDTLPGTSNLRYTFYDDGEMVRSSNDTTMDGTYIHDPYDSSLVMLLKDTTFFKIEELNSSYLRLAAKIGADSLVIESQN